MIYSEYGFLDPVRIIWRSGGEGDPYVDRSENLKCVNQKIVLAEIPSKFDRVKIDGLREVNYERYHARELGVNDFAVDYSTGIVQLHASQEAKTLNVTYKGRGFIQYPSSRIYHADDKNDVVLTLEEIIDRAIKEFERIDGALVDYESLKRMLQEALLETRQAVDNAVVATEEANLATERALDAYQTTRLVFKPYVQTYDEIMFKYPSPNVGWTTQVYDTGIRYRYDGKEWVPIDLFGGSIPLASTTRDGLMSKEAFQKLENLDSLPKERTLIFVLPYINIGVNNILARFPYSGRIKDVKAFCSKAGVNIDTDIDIEKSVTMENWTSIFSNEQYLTIPEDSYFDDGTKDILVRDVQAGDIFRINVKSLGTPIEGVTIEIQIEV